MSEAEATVEPAEAEPVEIEAPASVPGALGADCCFSPESFTRAR